MRIHVVSVETADKTLEEDIGVQFHTSLRCLRGSESRCHTDPWWWVVEQQLHLEPGQE